jgi:signal transduction histidine kinase
LGLGLFLIARRPDDVVPRLLALALLGTAATFNLPAHRAFHIIGNPLPVELAHFTFHVVSGITYVWAVVLFPSGRLPAAPHLRPAVRWVAAAVVTAASGWVSWQSAFYAHLQFFVLFFGIAVPVIGVTAQSVRVADPRTASEDRRAARLLTGALLPCLALALVWLLARSCAALGLSGAASVATHGQEWFPGVFALVPVVLFAGVIRYRLWDIDRLLSRILTYAVIMLALSAVYVGAVVSGGRFFGGGLLLTTLVLAAAATLIEPLRVSGARWANRVVFGQVLSPDEAHHTLLSGLEQLSSTGGIDQLVSVACGATRAQAATVWLRNATMLEPAAHCGAHPPTDPGAADASVYTWPIAYQSEQLGVLALDFGDARPSRTDRAVAGQVATHAGLIVHNAQLTVRLAQHVLDLEEQSQRLQHARRHLVAAQDAERRRLERDLHDGAQQTLVAAIITAPTDPAAAAEVLDLARSSLAEAWSPGRLQPLDGQGLAAALAAAASLAERAGIRVTVDVDTDDLAAEVETAVYFCCVEGLQNVVKHSGAQRAWVRVCTDGPVTTFEIADDGHGPAARTGAVKLGDRLAPFGGTVVLSAGPTGGAVLRGTIPNRAAASA